MIKLKSFYNKKVLRYNFETDQVIFTGVTNHVET